MCTALMAYYVKPAPPDSAPNAISSEVGLSVGGARLDGPSGFSAAVVVKPGARLSGCNPVEVLAVFSGTSQFWQRNAARLPRSVPFAIGIWGDEVRNVRVQLLATSAGSDIQYLESSLAYRDGAMEASSESRRALRMHRPQVDESGYVARGEIDGWTRSWAPIAISYEARLASGRGVGSCFVHPPSLTNGTPALVDLAPRYRAAPAFGYGSALTGELLLSLDGAAFVDSRRAGSSRGPSGDAQITRCPKDTSSCGLPVAIEVHNASTVRSIALFLLGALVALAMQMIYEAATLGATRGSLTPGRIFRALLAAGVVLALVLLYSDTEFAFENYPARELFCVGLVGGLLVGRWWLLLAPWLTLPGLLLYSLHFSVAARTGWAFDTGMTAKILAGEALLVSVSIAAGVGIRRRIWRRSARRPGPVGAAS
jgi:hypothetical protein